jgi:DNA (cytosine-5)-methyltransferase 1
MMDAYGNLPSLLEQVEEYLGDISLDGEQSVPLSGKNIQQAYCAPDKMTKFSRLSRFGMTYKPLTESRGEELLTLYLADFHAKTSAQQDEVQELTENDQVCGNTWRESLGKLDPDTLLWRTAQCSLLEDLELSLQTFPRWGLMQNGALYPQQTLVQTISVKESGLEPNNETFFHTPNTTGMDGGSNSRKALKKRTKQICSIAKNVTGNLNQDKLQDLDAHNAEKHNLKFLKWPTPRSCSAMAATITPESAWNEKRNPNLETIVGQRMWPTPTCHLAKETNAPSEKNRDTPSIISQIYMQQPKTPIGGKLNPQFVEWLMGWPLGWTDLKPLETDKFLCVQQQHGNYLNEKDRQNT